MDATGQRTITKVNTVGGLTFLGAITAATQADYQQLWQSLTTLNPAPATTAAAYQSVGDRAALIFVCADGTNVTLIIPAPKLSCFLADGETVDPASAPISPLITGAVGALTNQSGSPATAFLAGYLLPRSRTPL